MKMSSLASARASAYQYEMFCKDCARRKLGTWQERKAYAQKDKVWSQIIEWRPWPGKQPSDVDYSERPYFGRGKDK